MACFLEYFCFSNVLKSAITTWLEVRSIHAHKVILWKINLIKIQYNIKLLLYDQGNLQIFLTIVFSRLITVHMLRCRLTALCCCIY